MGKFTSKIDGLEMKRLLRLGLMTERDDVTEGAKFSLRRKGDGWNFVITLEGDEIDGNEEEWKEIVRADRKTNLKFLGGLIVGITAAIWFAIWFSNDILPMFLGVTL